MRAILSVSILAFVLAGCSEADEPITRLDDLPRLSEGSESPSEGLVAPSGGSDDGVAHAQAPRRRPPPPPQPVQPAPSSDAVTPGDQRAPDSFTARLVTTKGNIDIAVTRAWSPHGADRFYTLIREGFYTDVAFFRVIPGFMAQGGLHGDPAVNRQWRARRIPDDPSGVQHNQRGFVSFAMAGPGSRTTQFFISLVDNSRLDSMGFSPFGRVAPASLAVVDQLHGGYGEGAPRGRGPAQGRIQNEGNTYLQAEFPELDYIRSAEIRP